MLKKTFLLIFIFIYCGNSESLETISNTQITNAGIDSMASNSSTDTTSTTIFTQFPVSSILKLSPTSDNTTSVVPQPIIGETTTTTVLQNTTTTTVPQTTTTTTTVPQTTTTTTTVPQTTINIGVTVANNSTGSVYFLNGSQDATINVTTGNKYRFDLSDSSNINHPLRFSTTQNGSEYSSNVTTNGVAGNPGAYIEIEITSNTPNQLYIYCTNHFGMGGSTTILKS